MWVLGTQPCEEKVAIAMFILKVLLRKRNTLGG